MALDAGGGDELHTVSAVSSVMWEGSRKRSQRRKKAGNQV